MFSADAVNVRTDVFDERPWIMIVEHHDSTHHLYRFQGSDTIFETNRNALLPRLDVVVTVDPDNQLTTLCRTVAQVEQMTGMQSVEAAVACDHLSHGRPPIIEAPTYFLIPSPS